MGSKSSKSKAEKKEAKKPEETKKEEKVEEKKEEKVAVKEEKKAEEAAKEEPKKEEPKKEEPKKEEPKKEEPKEEPKKEEPKEEPKKEEPKEEPKKEEPPAEKKEESKAEEQKGENKNPAPEDDHALEHLAEVEVRNKAEADKHAKEAEKHADIKAQASDKKNLDPKYEEFLNKLEEVKKSNTDNLCAKYLSRKLFTSYTPEQQEYLYRCALSGIENPDSHLGAYAMRPNDYREFAAFFDPLIREYHKAPSDAKHITDWDASQVGENGVLDVTKLGLSELSMRVRVGRNLKKFNLPGAMDKNERIQFEKAMLQAFEKLIAMPEFGGRVYSLTPDFGNGETNPNLITKEEYQKLVDDHVMFKDMSADPYLKSAGIANDWSYGRGCYMSADGQVIVWMGEEDQLRIMVMKKGTKLNEVFDRLHEVLQVIEKIPGIEFAVDEDFGYVTSCPSNLGTGMRASVHVKIPKLTQDGTDKKAKEICKPLGLSVRGLGGEHTPIGADGTIDLSPSARLFIKERDIIARLYEGIRLLMEEENKA